MPDSSPFPPEPILPSGHPPVDRSREMEAWRRRSKRIRFWRRALPLTMAGIAGLVVLWIAGRSVVIKLTAPRGPATPACT